MNTNIQLTTHFNLREFVKSDEGLTVEVIENLRKLAMRLEEVRHQLGDKPITITSGFRTLAHNRSVGGARGSQHLYGNAADIVVEGMTPREVQKALKDWRGGMGFANSFTHLDTRPYKARWNY